MEVKEFEEIKGLISNAEMNSAKAQGILDEIKKGWKEKFGTDDIEEVKKELNKLRREYKKASAELDDMKTELVESYDWDKLEQELN